jgi:hypothetical protein
MADKRYLVFDITSYYPSGGMGDLQHSVDTIDEVYDWLNSARKKGETQTNFGYADRIEVYDRIEGVEVEIDERLLKRQINGSARG